jgi:glyoxylase-like metal-dependent hydrolase (beta-lactamase superfamily II)
VTSPSAVDFPAPPALHVGEITVQPLIDGVARLTPDMFAGSDFTGHEHLLDADGVMVVPVGGFLVRTGARIVLIDAGVGEVHDEMFDGGTMLADLARHGLTPEQIDTVIVTHLHSDHFGWLQTDGHPTFANADVRVGAADWAFFVEEAKGGRRRAEQLRVVEGQLDTIDRDGVEVAPGITTRATPGHTPGHTSVVLSSGRERMIVLGDALHCPAQLTNAEWEFVFDVDSALAVRTREVLLREADDPSTVLLPCHFPGMQAARLVRAEAGAPTWVLGG